MFSLRYKFLSIIVTLSFSSLGFRTVSGLVFRLELGLDIGIDSGLDIGLSLRL
jgi:hypothetical protein